MMDVDSEIDAHAGVSRLTPRQVECLRFVYARRTSKEIAAIIGLSSATVDSYITDAVALLGARNRRHAAELLHRLDPPEKLGSQFPRDETAAFSAQKSRGRPFRWYDWLSLREPGAIGNDIHPTVRILSVPIIAVILVIGFGTLVNGARIVSDLFAIWLH